MTERAAFILAIRAAPNDDAPRLVFADWLQENGEESLAHFIRHSIETKNTRRVRRRSVVQFAPRIPGLIWKRVWYADRIRALGFTPPAAGLDRGLTTIVWIEAIDWLTHGDAIACAHPIHTVVMSSWPRLVPSPPEPGQCLEGRKFRGVPKDLVRPDELRRFRGRHPWIGLMAARDRLLIPRLLAAEWPDIEFHLPAV